MPLNTWPTMMTSQSYCSPKATGLLLDIKESWWWITILQKKKSIFIKQGICNPMDYIVHGILQARILERVAFPFSRRSSWPRNRARVFCTAGRFFANWAIRKAHPISQMILYNSAPQSPASTTHNQREHRCHRSWAAPAFSTEWCMLQNTYFARG